jgi:hypothetical protein
MTISENGGKSFLSGKNWGGRLQFGVNVFASKHVTAQGLIGGEYALVKTPGLELDFSGALIGVNIIFSKLPFTGKD